MGKITRIGSRNSSLDRIRASFFSPISSRRYRYGIALLSACAAIVLRLAFLPSLGTRVTYLTFYPAVMFAALYGGVRAGLLATALSVALADYFLIEPFGSLTVAHSSDLLGIAVFLFSCVCISFLAEAMHRAQRRAATAEAELQHADELKRNEQRLRTLNRTLRALKHSSQALARATDEPSLLREVCRIIVEECGHAMVWIGFAENDAGKSIRPAAYSGFDAGYLETLKLTWADTERGRGPTGRAIRTGTVNICRDMLTDPDFATWREEARRRGYASSIAFPLSCGGSVIGALTLYAREPNPFSDDELGLLTELASDLAFGICSLRLRQVNVQAEAENKRSQRERDLTIAFLRMVNLSKNSTELLRNSALFFKKHADCDAVGIRLRNGNDFPYCQTLGFSDAFLESEQTLCTCCETGGTASLACLCGKVINGDSHPKNLTFTSHGSFWSNDSSALLQQPFDNLDLIRCRCIQEGYGSIVLLPLHDGPARLGLVQLNAWRKDAFTPEAVSLWERLSDHLAVAAAKLQTEEALRDSEELNRQTLQALPAHIAVIDRNGRVVVVNEAWMEFARDNDASDSDTVKVGSNYLDACRRSAATNDADAVQSLAGIEDVLAGVRKQFALEYPCHSPQQQRWFLMTVTPFGAAGEGGAVITHLDITARKQAEIARQQSLEELRDSRLAALGLMQDAVEARRQAEKIGAALQASEQRIQQALHVSHSFTFEWLPPSDLVTRSTSCGPILNLTGDAACRDTGERFFQRVHPEDRERFLQVLHGLTPATPSYLVEYRVTRGDDTIVVLEETGQASFDDAGELQRIVGVTTDITAHKQAEEQLFETSQRLQALMAAVPVGISFSDDATCQRIGGNPAVLAQFDVSPEENLSASAALADAPGRKVKFFSRGKPITDAELPLQRAVAENNVIPPMELEVLLPSGRRWFADASGAPVRDAQGNVIGGIAVTVDITERKRGEEALRASEERLRLAQSYGEVGVWDWNVENGQLMFEPELEQLYGLATGTIRTYQDWASRVHPVDLARVEAERTTALARHEPFQLEFRIRHASGTERWIMAKGRGEYDAAGRLRDVRGVNIDITERKQAEELLQESEARFHNVFDHAATGIAITDCAGNYVQCNAAYCNLTGYSQAELTTLAFPSLIHPEDRELNIGFIRRLMAGDLPSFEIENRYLRKAGDFFWVHKYVSLLRDDGGQPTHIVALVTDITERKQTEEVLRFLGQCNAIGSGEDFFQALARYLAQSLNSDFVCIDRLADDQLSAQTLAVFHNGRFEDNVSYTLKDTPCGDVVGRSICCFPRNVRGLFAKDAVLQELQAESYLGTTLWSSQGNPIGLIAVIGRQPLTDTRRAEALLQMVGVRAAGELERQQAETELRKSREDLNRAQVVAHVGSWRLNVQRNELLWSDENWRIFGIPKGTPLTYETFLSTIHPDDRAYVHEHWSAALRGEPYNIEHRIVVNGVVKWVRERAELEFGPAGALQGGFGTTQDITERKLAETVNARYELIAQYARDPLLLVDLDGNIIEANQAAVQLYGYSRKELLKLRLHALRQDDAEVVDLQMQRARTQGVLFESVHVCKDGVCVPVEVSARGVFIEGKEMLLSVIRDIRQRKETEMSLRRAKEDAERASQAKSDFLASMSHELRTPLNAIMGFSQVLENEYFGPLSDKQKEYATDIYESGKHLLSLINDILELSKIEAGKMEPRWSRVNVGTLLEHSRVFVKEKCFKQDIHLDFEIDDPVRGLTLRADERRLKQIMYNLLSNASKFTPSGGSIRVWARLLKGDEPALEVSVSDTGIGIAPEHQERVFEAFYQVHQGTLNKTPGTGLGLSLVKQLVAMHGGQVWLTSEGEGRGSRFTFVIPAIDPVPGHTSEGGQ